MTEEIALLTASTATAAALHAALGADHYLPLAAVARQRRMSMPGVLALALGAGSAHIGVTALLAALAGWYAAHSAWGTTHVAWSVAALIAAGILYAAQDLPYWRARAKHRNLAGPIVVAAAVALGPCEPLLPLLLYPAVSGIASVWLLTGVFASVTVATMAVMLVAVSCGLHRLRWPAWAPARRYGHVAVGAVLVACGAAMLWLGHDGFGH